MKRASPIGLRADLFFLRPLAALVAAALPCAATAEQALRMDRIEVIGSASRVDEPLEAVPASVSVLDRADIFEGLAFDLRSLLRYEPGISIDSNPARFGLGNVNIRGLEGNRVQMTLDGIRLPESYRVGSFSNASRNALGLGLIRRVEVVRGPASAVHGSDALAGVLAFTTVEPRDYVHGTKRVGGEVFANFAEADTSYGGGAVLAAAAGATRWLVGYERRDGHETQNRGEVGGTGAARTLPNPQDTTAESQLLKGSVSLPAGWIASFTLDRFERGVRTDVLSLNPQSARTVSLAGDDHAERTRASAAARGFDIGPFSQLALTLYTQRSETRQDTDEVRANTTTACLSAAGTISCEREARFLYTQRETGFIAIGEMRPLGNHHWVAGTELSRVHADERREGRQTILSTGVSSNVVGGELLPTRDFPVSDTDRFGVFVQDRIEVAALTWVPGIRYDRFRLAPRADTLFRVNRPVVALEESAWSPRVGTLWRVAPRWTLTAQLATGFRAPPAADLNIGLSSLPAGYAVVGNPDLRSETSRGAELGARYLGGGLAASLAAFHTRYRDLILSRAALPCPADPRCVPGATGTFQSQNVSSARIQGIEARAEWHVSPWTARAAYSHARGDDLDKHLPLNSIDPPRLVAGIEWGRGPGALALHVTRVAKPSRVDLSPGIRFVPPAWTSADLTARYTVRPGVEVNAGIFNLGDRKLWLWSDVRNLTNVTAGFDRYTQPGRNVAIGVRAVF